MTSVTIVTIGSPTMVYYLIQRLKSLHHIYVTFMCRKNAKVDIV